MKEETYISKHLEKEGYGTFRVPEGYFDILTTRVMQQIDAIEANAGTNVGANASERLNSDLGANASERLNSGVPTLRSVGSYRGVWLYAAAISIMAVLSATLLFNSKNNPPTSEVPTAPLQAQATIADDYFDQAADYAMLDNQDIYSCLMDSEDYY